MGLSVQWALICNTKDCTRSFTDEMAKLSEKNPGMYHNLYRPGHILVCTGDDGVCLEFKFEPWEKALNQSYLLKKARFKVLGFGDPVFDGVGPFGHHHPPKMVELLKEHSGVPTKSMEAGPVLGKSGYQTGDWVKTEYAGIEHHIKACKILDRARKLADKSVIDDDGDYCGDNDKHDLKDLHEAFEGMVKVHLMIGQKLKEAGWKDEQIAGHGIETSRRLKGGGQ
jgi:hypothetical protein